MQHRVLWRWCTNPGRSDRIQSMRGSSPARTRAMSTKRSRVNPKYKTKYRVGNWPEYDRSLVERGDLTLWLSEDSIANWNAKPTARRGGQQKYSDLAIETALTLRLLLHLPLRQTEGFLVSIFGLLGLHLDVPDHTTLSRRSARLDVPLRSRPRPMIPCGHMRAALASAAAC